MPWRFFLSPEFRTKFQREVPLFLEITEFPFNTVGGSWWKEAHMQKKQLDSFNRFDRTPTCDRHGHRLMASTADAQHRAVKTAQVRNKRTRFRLFSFPATAAEH